MLQEFPHLTPPEGSRTNPKSSSLFESTLSKENLWPLRPDSLEIFQINLGYMCNQTCKHCHVDAGPTRKEVMSEVTLSKCLEIIKSHEIKSVDLTGGAPEMNPNFKWFVEQLSACGVSEIMVRSNLTIYVANPKFNDLPEFFKSHKVRVISSLPHFKKARTDRQRGLGVFERSIKGLKMLNYVGYGQTDSGLILDLVYNPSGAFLPGDQTALELEFKQSLHDQYGIKFNHLLTITNLPVSRFKDYLIKSNNYEQYMNELIDSFNPASVKGLMCKNTISVDWNGNLYDCDFNQMLDMKIHSAFGNHIDDFDPNKLNKRTIKVNDHCFGCTAGSGSSCQGATT